MFRIALVVCSFASASALACPDLAGDYTCVSQYGHTWQVPVSQAEVNGVMVYYWSGMELITDNTARPLPDTDTSKNQVLKAWCGAENNLLANLTAAVYDGGANNKFVGDADVTADFRPDANNGIVYTSSGAIKLAGGGVSPIQMTTRCARN